jgi:hypothetical protein
MSELREAAKRYATMDYPYSFAVGIEKFRADQQELADFAARLLTGENVGPCLRDDLGDYLDDFERKAKGTPHA